MVWIISMDSPKVLPVIIDRMGLTGVCGLTCRLFDRHPADGHAMRFVDVGEDLNMLGIEQFEKLRGLVGAAIDRSMRR